MIVIALETIDHEQKTRDFYLILRTIEEALDAINVVSENCSLIDKAYLIENGQWLGLPVEIFDGKSFTEPISDLKKEWIQLLKVTNN